MGLKKYENEIVAIQLLYTSYSLLPKYIQKVAIASYACSYRNKSRWQCVVYVCLLQSEL